MSVRLTVQLQIQPGKNAEFEAAASAGIARVKAEAEFTEMVSALERGLEALGPTPQHGA